MPGEVFHPLAWTPREAHRFLQDLPHLLRQRRNRVGDRGRLGQRLGETLELGTDA